MSELRKVVLIKDYPVRHDMIIETGSAIHISENRALQLARNGFLEFKGSGKKQNQEQTKAGRVKKEIEPIEIQKDISED